MGGFGRHLRGVLEAAEGMGKGLGVKKSVLTSGREPPK
jgi:hypothetical protein